MSNAIGGLQQAMEQMELNSLALVNLYNGVCKLVLVIAGY